MFDAGYTRELRKTKVVVRPHHDHLFAKHQQIFDNADQIGPIGGSTPAVPFLSIHQAGTENLPFGSNRKFLIFTVPECPSGCSTAFR